MTAVAAPSLVLSVAVPGRGLDVALEVARGETLALLGPNGAGKSTLLAVAAGLLRPYDGTVALGDRVLSQVDAGRTQVWVPPHRRRVGLLDQRPLLFPHLSVLDNVAFGPRSAGAGRRASRATARARLADVGLAELADRPATDLSGGQAQRVAIARALAAAPDLVLLDEPLAALDVDVAPALRHLLRDVLAERTCLVATHDVLDVLLLADRVAVVQDGRVVEQGPTGEVLARPRSAFAARLAGLDLVRGTWRRDHLVTAGGATVHGLTHGDPPAEGAPATAVFRPSAVSVYLEPVSGSPRNAFAATVTTIEPRGDLVRVGASDGHLTLRADVTPGAVADLRLAPGTPVHLSVKATEVSVYAV